MKIKTLQILLVFAAVLCAVGFFCAFGRNVDMDEKNFTPSTPPDWLNAMEGLSGGVKLSVQDLTSRKQPLTSWEQPLTIRDRQTMTYDVVVSGRSDEPNNDVRKALFKLTGEGLVDITYKPNSLQISKSNGKVIDNQTWNSEKRKDATFFVYNLGGTFTFTNNGGGYVEITLEN